MSKKKLAGIIAVCAIAIIVIIVLFSTKPWDGPGRPEGWETYNNVEYGFQFNYPETWGEVSFPGSVVAIAEPLSGTFRHNINVVVEPTSLTLEQYIVATRQLMVNLGCVISSEDYLTVSGRRGHEWIMTMEWLAPATKQRQLIFVANGNAHILTCSALPETYNSYSDTFDTIAESFVVG